ncbi:hypothetical protein [Texcoconibacillus texcoconensis]|uniref:Uncharacterized protein n=1 Tax=Texcoconibacillus texcoconensis TaxID=1095777 RepID=A0A840QIR4_9BACI|nr:hypothetical protein [Texcoconibacillus texcoconensis]MBB5171985.1 hypothetical protein [Texcoconibacillus texcoconensis]
MDDQSNREESALATVRALLQRFEHHVEEDGKLPSYRAYEEDLLDKALPSEADIDHYDFQINQGVAVLMILFVFAIPSFSFIRIALITTEDIAALLSLLAILTASFAAFLFYKLTIFLLQWMTDNKRASQNKQFWQAIRENCHNHLSYIEKIKKRDDREQDLKNDDSMKEVTITEVNIRENEPSIATGFDQSNNQLYLRVSNQLGTYINHMQKKGFSFVIKANLHAVADISLTQLKRMKYDTFFINVDGKTEEVPEEMMKNIYHRVALAYTLSKKEAQPILQGKSKRS